VIVSYMKKEEKIRYSIVEVADLRLRCYIGFNEWEKVKLQDVVISFSFKYNAAKAVETDDVKHAVNYKRMTKEVIQLVDGASFHLIETLAEHVYQYIKANPYLADVSVTVEKPYALRFADNVMIHIDDSDRPAEVVIGMGSNIEPEENIELALEELEEIGHVLRTTDFYYTAPLKYEDQPDFLNGAIVLQTSLPLELLALRLRWIEERLGRVRTENKNGPRTIDLDIVLYNGVVIDEEGLETFDFLREFIKELRIEE